MTSNNNMLDLQIEEAEAFDAPSEARDFLIGLATGVAAGLVVVAIAT
jgi:hypothetical protein